ncbi:TrlF family AAA-like ATPase [Marinilabilia salmonicolor]|uniref:PHP domain-containing protein n=1 Tax=Marinilabilia salmonicolor TaxID=989 RepID=A0A368UIW9_9BACT|nr:PHP domain-containing protein [Marinilabilia salmonicolor]RCW20769.1 PHP domain-containing protein [Marinilabilia salmonicolor]
MDSLNEINKIENGAKFFRADLHIHSYGEVGSYDVTDTGMTPTNIIDKAIEEKLSIISITDHNSIGNLKEAIEYSEGKDIYLIPGVELSTSQGHLLVYFPDLSSISAFMGKLDISDNKELCNHTIVQCLDLAKKYDGIGILSHIDSDAGFEIYMKGYTPFKEEILLHDNLYGFEITKLNSIKWFTDLDDVEDRRNLINKRRKKLNEDPTLDIAKTLSSDSHSIEGFGKNLDGAKKLTRIKIDDFNFHSFKIALKDSAARVRLEDVIPNSIPHFIGIKYHGGILDNQIIKFSKNLNCLIGGRGTGKSTILESVRTTSGNKTRNELVDNEVWPDRISLVYQDETGRIIEYAKDKLNSPINQTDPENGLSYINIESIGQGETAETIKNCDKDPIVLLDFIDDFIDFGDYKGADDEICQELLDNQSKLERLALEVSNVEEIKKAKLNSENQLNALKSKNAKKVVELEESLAGEKLLRDELVDYLNKLFKGIKDSLSDKSLFSLVLELDDSKVKIGKDEFAEVKNIVNNLSNNIDSISSQFNADSKEVIESIKKQLKEWNAKEAKILNQIEEIRKELESKGVKLDIAFIRKITKDVTDYTTKLNEIKKKQEELKKLKKERIELVNKRIDLKNKVYYLRHDYAKQLNDNLKSTVIDYGINLKFVQGTFSVELSNIIKECMGWRTSQVPKADLMVNQLGFHKIYNSINRNDIADIIKVKSTTGNSLFNSSEANIIIQELSKQENLFRIERCAFEDFPSINVTKLVIEPDGERKTLIKNFSKLSLGQQQSIMLSILLFSKRNCPLILDQPEDNLDSEFVFKTLVKNLRRIKEYRQVIVVTHNANIAVLGDAELIIPLKSTSERTHILDRGSIDNLRTKKHACDILEGGELAFRKRQEIYDL